MSVKHERADQRMIGTVPGVFAGQWLVKDIPINRLRLVCRHCGGDPAVGTGVNAVVRQIHHGPVVILVLANRIEGAQFLDDSIHVRVAHVASQ
jgi:hypothetical protein